MPAESAPQAPPTKNFESPLDFLPLVKTIKEAKKFLSTRKAVLAGEPLYNLTQDEIKARDLMGPWAFNATQSLIDSIPGLIISGCIWIIFSKTAHSLPKGADPLQQQIADWLKPLMAPFTLLAIVWVISIACIPRGFYTKENLHAAQRKYLYLDGAYGFYPQLGLATFLAFFSVPPSDVMKSQHVAVVVGIAVFCYYVDLFLARHNYGLENQGRSI